MIFCHLVDIFSERNRSNLHCSLYDTSPKTAFFGGQIPQTFPRRLHQVWFFQYGCHLMICLKTGIKQVIWIIKVAMRLVVFPIIYNVWNIPKVVLWDFWTINSIWRDRNDQPETMHFQGQKIPQKLLKNTFTCASGFESNIALGGKLWRPPHRCNGWWWFSLREISQQKIPRFLNHQRCMCPI